MTEQQNRYIEVRSISTRAKKFAYLRSKNQKDGNSGTQLCPEESQEILHIRTAIWEKNQAEKN